MLQQLEQTKLLAITFFISQTSFILSDFFRFAQYHMFKMEQLALGHLFSCSLVCVCLGFVWLPVFGLSFVLKDSTYLVILSHLFTVDMEERESWLESELCILYLPFQIPSSSALLCPGG